MLAVDLAQQWHEFTVRRGIHFVAEGDALTMQSSQPTGRACVYLEPRDALPVRAIEATFSFTAKRRVRIEHGTVLLGQWSSSMGRTTALGDPPPDGACHLTISPLQWVYSVWSRALKGPEVIRRRPFFPPLRRDGTEYTARVEFDGSTAVLVLPRDRCHSLTDPRIGERLGPWPCFEIFSQDVALDAQPRFHQLSVVPA